MPNRYEFRVFGKNLRTAREALVALFPPPKTETVTDVYLLDRDLQQSFKLRGAEWLELKCLRGRKKRFQRWQPAGHVRLPATGRQIFENIDVATLPDLQMDQIHDAPALLAAFRQFGHTPVRVAKHRLKFETDGVLAEHVHLTIRDGQLAQTVAIEGTSILALSETLERIGLTGARNVSYPAFLARRDSGFKRRGRPPAKAAP